MDIKKVYKINELDSLKKDEHEKEKDHNIYHIIEYLDGEAPFVKVKEKYNVIDSKYVLIKRKFYNKENIKEKEIIYTETFTYADPKNPTIFEKCISQIKVDGKVIGYRYYDPNNSNNYFSIVKDGKQYKILDDKKYDENIRIAESIIREHFKDKPDYVITGKKHQVFGILITLKENNKNVIVPFGTSGRVNEYWTDNSKIRDGNIQTETFFNITSTNTYENFRKYLIETFEIDVSDKDKDYH